MATSCADIESGTHRLRLEESDRLRLEESSSRSEMVGYLDSKLRSFAFILALIEKASSTLGTMNFIWATVVLLGAFSQSLKSIDFWFVTTILVVEGLRILCQRGELATRQSRSYDFNFCNFNISNIILSLIYAASFGMQENSAITCIVLSSLRIHKQQYGSDPNPNRNRALNLFYWLSVVESSMTLLGFVLRVALLYQPFFLSSELSENILSVVFGKSIYWALRCDGFHYPQLSLFRRYLYDTYCRCMNGSVFDWLKMDFVSYSVELLQSIDHIDQLTGARLLFALLKSDSLPADRLSVIGTPSGALERLIELLNWENPHKQEIRRVAAVIICNFVQIPLYRVRVMATRDSMESISSLLYDSNQIEIYCCNYQFELSIYAYEYDFSGFSMLGKRILQFLAKDPNNHAKIGTNKVLLRKIIALEHLNPNASESEIIRHLAGIPMETLADQQDVRENNNGTSGFEAEHSDDPNLQTVDSQV